MNTVPPATVFVLGGSGFVGRETVRTLVAAGANVIALARSAQTDQVVATLGARPVRGDATDSRHWASELDGAAAVIDLTQPPLPGRLTPKAVRAARDARLASTAELLNAVSALPAPRRPLIVNVSSVQDLAPDRDGSRSSRSALASTPRGFGRIGLPVRKAVEASGLDAVHVYFGNLVYGPGKAFADIAATVRTGSARIIGRGDNRLPLTSVVDASQALTHLLTLDRRDVTGRTVVAAPAETATQREFYLQTARALGRPVPGRAPRPIAALVAGSVNVQTMTFDARCTPDLLTDTGFRFVHPSITTGIPAAVGALQTLSSS